LTTNQKSDKRRVKETRNGKTCMSQNNILLLLILSLALVAGCRTEESISTRLTATGGVESFSTPSEVEFRLENHWNLSWVTDYTWVDSCTHPLMGNAVNVQRVAIDTWNGYARIADPECVAATRTLSLRYQENYRAQQECDYMRGEVYLTINVEELYPNPGEPFSPSSRLQTASTLAHEATHAWLVRNWHREKYAGIFFRFGKDFWGMTSFDQLIDRDEAGASTRFEATPESYVCAYGATSPHEDVAEMVEAYVEGEDDRIPNGKWMYLMADPGFAAFAAHAKAGTEDFLRSYPEPPALLP
jgi:hypothetical protein